jgi:hypothetical protein
MSSRGGKSGRHAFPISHLEHIGRVQVWARQIVWGQKRDISVCALFSPALQRQNPILCPLAPLANESRAWPLGARCHATQRWPCARLVVLHCILRACFPFGVQRSDPHDFTLAMRGNASHNEHIGLQNPLPELCQYAFSRWDIAKV